MPNFDEKHNRFEASPQYRRTTICMTPILATEERSGLRKIYNE